MIIGFRTALSRICIHYEVLKFSIRKFLFGFENANRLLRVCDKRAVIPILRKNGASIGAECDIESPLILHGCSNTYGNLKIGNKCHLGKEVFIDLSAPVVIGDCATISMRSLIISHIDVGSSGLREYGWKRKATSCVLAKGCYLGAGVMLLPGITVGECAFVGAGSIVTSSVPPWTMVVGVPAKFKRRLDVQRDK
jgi:acetyltransferase-like isoleucine patch superfamily enzyme